MELPLSAYPHELSCLLAGEELTVLRRISPRPTFAHGGWHFSQPGFTGIVKGHSLPTEELVSSCPLGGVGDRLWLREAFKALPRQRVSYRQDDPTAHTDWQASVRLPRANSRFLLTISHVSAGLLHDVIKRDAPCSEAFLRSWDRYNRIFTSKTNPWVWALKTRALFRPTPSR